MFGFVKKIFVSAMILFSFNVLNVKSLECVLMSKQEWKIRPGIININSNEPSFYPYRVKVSKSSWVVTISIIQM